MARRIKVADFRGEDVEIEFPNGSVYPIRGDLPMEIVAFMDQVEEDAGDEANDSEWLEKGHGIIVDLVRERTPDAVVPPLSPQELMGLMGSIVGGESVGHAIAEAMAAGLSAGGGAVDPPGVNRQTRRSATKRKTAAKRKTRSASPRVRR